MRKKNTFKTILTVLSGALCGACVFTAMSISSVVTAKADTTTNDIFCAGASIRVADDEQSGIRFHIRVKSDEDGNVKVDGVDYSFDEFNKLETGIEITPDNLAVLTAES